MSVNIQFLILNFFQAESLQDFRREREGHLMIRDDQPFLIMSFGSRYQGVHASKYKIEGKYHIPVGYKAIIKWDDDEIVFMSREGELKFRTVSLQNMFRLD